MSTVTTNGLYNNYWRSANGNNGNNNNNIAPAAGSISSGNHSPSSTSSSSSISNGSSNNNIASVHINNFNGHNTGLLLSPVKTSSSNGNGNRYQAPYPQQQQQQPSPLPRTINNTSKYTNSSSSLMNSSRGGSSGGGIYSSSYENHHSNHHQQQQQRNQYNSSNLSKFNQSSNEINITVNNSNDVASNNSRNKFYSTKNNNIGNGGNYYIPGIEKDKLSPSVMSSSSSSSSSGGGVSVTVGRSSSYNHINTIGRVTGYSSNNNNSSPNYNGHHQNIMVANGTSLNHSQQQQQNYQRVNSNSQHQQQHQQRRMNNSKMSNPNGVITSNNNDSSTSSLNGTVAVAVVTRPQNKQNETAVVSSSQNGYTNSNTTNNKYLNSNRVLGGNNNTNCITSESNSNSRNSTASRQIIVGGSNSGENCKNNNSQLQQQQRPVQKHNSYSATGTTRQIPITMEDDVSSSSTTSNNNKKVVNCGSSSVMTNNNNNNVKSCIVAGSAVSNGTGNNSAKNNKKGILRKDGKKKKMSVKFPKEVCEVIGYGGDTSDEESDEEPVPDPLDSASVQELLDKSASTSLEKELNRLTQKNTNFNSIKTNLLGYTSIEIGPILGSMNGMSLTGPSKPLISIGTFDSRNEPLKVKKFGYNSNSNSNASSNEEKEQTTIAKQTSTKKDSIVKVNGMSLNAKMNSGTLNTKANSVTNNSSNSNSSQQQGKNSKVSLTIISNTASNNNSSAINNNKPISIEKSNSYSASSSSTAAAAITKSNFNSSNNASINANSNTNGIITVSTTTKSTSTTSKSNQVKQNNSTNNINTNKIVTGSGSNPENNTSKFTKDTQHIKSIAGADNSIFNANNIKNIMPGSENIKKESSSNSHDNDTSTPPPPPITPAPRTSLTSKLTTTNANNTKPNATLNNLFILDDGNIASRRSTFLNDILSLDTPIRLDTNENADDSSLRQDSLEPPRIIKSEPKLESPTLARMMDTNFDDSLEDSGLDIKTIKSTATRRDFVSESDNEKSGSNSDSGTEPDFKGRKMTIGNMTDEKNNGLFISVDEEDGSNELQSQNQRSGVTSKLSPDSVLSEMSTTESLLRDEEELSQHGGDYDGDGVPLEVVPSNVPTSSGPTIPPLLKRTAPLPPSAASKPSAQHQRGINEHKPESFYTNTNEEELYDDVATLHDDRSKLSVEENHSYSQDTYNNNDESLYDDCAALGPPPPIPTSASPSAKVTSGSYDFTDAMNRSGLDSDFNEKIPLKPDDGIEFIGIRKIDSELFLNKLGTSQSQQASPSSKKDRQGSVSPKPAKRRVNQFFSTIGKRAGAAFRSTPLDFSNMHNNNNKTSFSSSPPLNSNASPFAAFSNFKRSLSQDEVNMTRTQEIYATLSPTMLKNKGLAPVLNKLSKLELQYNNSKENCKDEDKVSRKNKFSISLKKFLKFGTKDGENKYDLEQQVAAVSAAHKSQQASPTGSDKLSKSFAEHDFQQQQDKRRRDSPSSLSSKPQRHSSVSHLEEISSNNPGKYYVGPSIDYGPSPSRPPPPPPRVCSVDQLDQKLDEQPTLHSSSYRQQQAHSYNNSGSGTTTTSHHNNNGYKPARPPPPVIRTNKVAPSFVSVFAGNDNSTYSNVSNDKSPPLPPPPVRRPSSSGSFVSSCSTGNVGNDGGTVRNNPPNKPKRKASIYRAGESSDQGAYTANYLETTYNHITSLNFESLKLIASQQPAIIRKAVTQLQKYNKAQSLRWTQFYVTDVEPLIHGKGFCFYSAFWEDESCILLVQESLSSGIPPLEFDCVESMASFEDIIPTQIITWKPSEFVNTNAGVKVFVSVLPPCTVQTLTNYLNNSSVSPSRKYFALLQATDYWGRDEISDMIVFHQTPNESDSPISDYSCGSLASKSKHSNSSPNFGLVYVVSTRLRSGSSLLSTTTENSRSTFEAGIKRLLFSNNSYQNLLCENDENILYRRICSSNAMMSSHEIEAQLKLFLQLKLFGAQGSDLDKILRYRSDKQVTQWMDKERAFCMKDAIERTLQRNAEPISPLRKSFVEFLMISDSCAKAVLDLIVELNPDD